MVTTTATMNAHQQALLPLNWGYWDQDPVPLSLQIPRTTPGKPFWYQNQTTMPSKRFSIPRRPLPTRQSSSSPSDSTKPAPPKREKMRPENLPPLIIPRRQSSHQALLLQLQVVGVPGAVNLRKTLDSEQSQKRQSPKQAYQQQPQPQILPYRQYQHERVYQAPITPKRAEREPSSQRIASAPCPVVKPVPIPIPSVPVPLIPDTSNNNNYPPNSSTTRRLSQVIHRVRSRSKSRDRRKSTKVDVEPETPFLLASAPYGTGNTLNLGTPFLPNDAPVVVEPDTPFLALRLERNTPTLEEDDDFLRVINNHNHGHSKEATTMTMTTFLSKHKYPPLSNNQTSFVQSPARYYDFDCDDDARAILPSQSPKKEQQLWYLSDQEQAQRKKTLKRSSAVYYGGKEGRSRSRKDTTMSPRSAGNGFSAGGGRPVSLPPWSRTLHGGQKREGELDVAEIYASMDPDRDFGGGERGRKGRERSVDSVTPDNTVMDIERDEKVERMDSFSSAVSEETSVAEEEQDRREEGRKKPGVVSQHEPEQKLVDEFGERERAALRELLEYVDSILEPTESTCTPVRSGVRCAGGEWSREQSWWRDVRRSLQ
ncbi:hypothetical protein B0T21DRAFT_334732 [Apiosordaria backusii]|uniref:Uncharacterized protein n=1 Tax=Apiosordaria backusii TaxID=314023 RepID=A0AA40BE12_9PEZI|nr:hypothetical protein B0T21DRAFT_334732 [Apiosordaria backusii]